MRARHIATIGLYVMGLCAGPQAAGGPVDGDATQIREAIDSLNEAIMTRDVFEAGNVWLRDDTVSAIHPASQEPDIGWESVKRSLEHSFAHNRNISLESRAGAVYVTGDVAVLLDATAFRAVQTQTGQPIMLPNVLGTRILKRVAGTWRVLHSHTHQPRFQPHAEHTRDGGTVYPSQTPVDDLHTVKANFMMALSEGNTKNIEQILNESNRISGILPDVDAPLFGSEALVKTMGMLFEKAWTQGGRAETNQLQEHREGHVAWFIDRVTIISNTDLGGNVQNAPRQLLATTVFEHNEKEWTLLHLHMHVLPEVSDASATAVHMHLPSGAAVGKEKDAVRYIGSDGRPQKDTVTDPSGPRAGTSK